MWLCLIELIWSVFASLYTSHYNESLQVCKHWIIRESLSYYIQLGYDDDDDLPGEN